MEKVKELYRLYKESSGVSIDTRTIRDGQMFFAIKGEKFDANAFVHKALESGASYIVTDQPSTQIKYAEAILVKDVVTALQQLAKYHRQQLAIPFIGITGSNGKTTTKELVDAVLSKKYKTYATRGNLNNHLGVPLTLLSVKTHCEMAIIEMGANHIGEISDLCAISNPSHGVITNIGKAHLEGFGSLEGVIQAKTELYKSIENANGLIFYNANSGILKNNLPDTENVPYGETIDVYSNYPVLEIKIDGEIYKSNLVGDYNAINIACAVSIGKYFEVSLKDIQEAIEDYNPNMNRSQIVRKKNFEVISDAYNANPISMKAAIENFQRIKHPNKVLIIGDMLELGEYTKAEHQNIVDSLNDFKGRVFLVGKHFTETKTDFLKYDNTKAFKQDENIAQLLQGALVLLKGSRGMALETLIQDVE